MTMPAKQERWSATAKTEVGLRLLGFILRKPNLSSS
jgi:hypothetical protein